MWGLGEPCGRRADLTPLAPAAIYSGSSPREVAHFSSLESQPGADDCVERLAVEGAGDVHQVGRLIGLPDQLERGLAGTGEAEIGGGGAVSGEDMRPVTARSRT
jgi:hypothetical protein